MTARKLFLQRLGLFHRSRPHERNRDLHRPEHSGACPRHASSRYHLTNVSAPQKQANLVSINSDGNAVMKVETTPQVQNTRQSIRITTQFTFTGGLVIMDSVHMPTGCGTWPAFWTNGPNWPLNGEIDIVEGEYTLGYRSICRGDGNLNHKTPLCFFQV